MTFSFGRLTQKTLLKRYGMVVISFLLAAALLLSPSPGYSATGDGTRNPQGGTTPPPADGGTRDQPQGGTGSPPDDGGTRDPQPDGGSIPTEGGNRTPIMTGSVSSGGCANPSTGGNRCGPVTEVYAPTLGPSYMNIPGVADPAEQAELKYHNLQHQSLINRLNAMSRPQMPQIPPMPVMK